MKKLFVSLFLFLPAIAGAENPDFSRFKSQTQLQVSGIGNPKVVIFESKLNPITIRKTALVDQNGEIVPHKWQQVSRQNVGEKPKISVQSVSSVLEGKPENLIDENRTTYFSFDPNADAKPEIELRFAQKTEMTGLQIKLDSGSASPRNMTIEADFGEGKWVSVHQSSNFYPTIALPKMQVNGLRIGFESNSLFRISEMGILAPNLGKSVSENLIFFAEDGQKYTLFAEADFGQKDYSSRRNSQPLRVDGATPKFRMPSLRPNLNYNPDFDRDGINDKADLCPKHPDPQNIDSDKNGRGDVCEDPDLDRIVSANDNCDFVHNPSQKDIDADGIGDACDDREDRMTENSDLLLYGVFGVGALLLGFLVLRSLQSPPNSSPQKPAKKPSPKSTKKANPKNRKK